MNLLNQLGRLFLDRLGTVFPAWGIGSIQIQDEGGNARVRKLNDSADAELTAARVNVTGQGIRLNSDATGIGTDQVYDILAPTTQEARVSFTPPARSGTVGDVLQCLGDGASEWASQTGAAAAGLTRVVCEATVTASVVTQRVGENMAAASPVVRNSSTNYTFNFSFAFDPSYFSAVLTVGLGADGNAVTANEVLSSRTTSSVTYQFNNADPTVLNLQVFGRPLAGTRPVIFVYITGTAALTTAAPTMTATGSTVGWTAAVAMSTVAPTMAATGMISIHGTSEMSTAAPTMSAVGDTVGWLGTSALTTAAPTMEATGSISLHGTSAMTLAAATMSASGSISLHGTSAMSTAAATMSASGTYTAPASDYLYDTFTDSNNTAWTSHVMNVGSGWNSGTKDDGSLAGSFTITAVNTGIGTVGGVAWIKSTAESSQADGTITLKLVDTGGHAAIVFRLSNSTNFWRGALGDNDGTLYMVKIVAGAGTVVASTSATFTTNQTITVVLNGTTIDVSYNGATLNATSQTHNQTATRHGVGFRQNSSSQTVDDFRHVP